MSDVAVLDESVELDSRVGTSEPELNHYYCGNCFPNGERMYCGFDGSDYNEIDEPPKNVNTCVVCVGISVCEGCGQ